MVTLTFDSIHPISLIVLSLIIANGFLLYVKQVTTPTPRYGGAIFRPRGIIWTFMSKELWAMQHTEGLALFVFFLYKYI